MIVILLARENEIQLSHKTNQYFSQQITKQEYQDAYLELTYMMTRGVSNWKEVQYDELPDKVQDKYTKVD